MNKYSYPAVFTPEENGAYSVNFPDFEGCYTCGDDLADSIYMAQDVLAFTIYSLEKENKVLPAATASNNIHLEAGEFVNVIACDTLAYCKKNSSRAVKKTLTIPEWLNDAATALDINFSQVLQNALLTIVQGQ